jgi:uncharacterized protein involved in exopolysaccharide biosynthesis
MNDSNSPVSQRDSASLRDMVAPIFRRRRLALLWFSGIVLGTILAAFFLANYYQVDFEILVERERQDPLVTTEQTNQPSQPASEVTPEEINSEIEILESGDLLQKVVLANGLQEREKHSLASLLFPKQSDAEYLAKAVKRLDKSLTIAPVEKSNNISVRYRSSDPKLAYRVMNSLANLYMEKHLSVHRPPGSLDFFTNETEKYRQALADSESKLASFGTTAGVAAPDVVRTYMAQQVAAFEGSLNQAKQAVASDEKRSSELKAEMQKTPSRSSTQEVSSQEAILLQQLQANLLAAQVKRTDLLMKYDPSYPLVREADQEIAETQAAISEAEKNQILSSTTDRDPTYELLRENLAQTQADLAAQLADVRATEGSIQNMQAKMVDLDQKAVTQSDLIRETKADESNYLLYLSKREQERTSDALDQKRIANVAIAVPPMLPVLPVFSPLLVLAIGFFLALFVGIGAAFLMDYLDVSFRTPTEVASVLEIPVLASIPRRVA